MKQKLIAFMNHMREIIVEWLKFIALWIACMLTMFTLGIFGSVCAYKIGLFKPLEVLMDIAQKYAN